MKRISLLLFVSIFIFSCKKSSDIGGNILPIDDLLNAQFTDTAMVLTKTVYDEAQRTDKMIITYLGTLNDANLGRSTATLVAELYKPVNVPLETLAPFTLDSTVLFIKYSSYYGDTTVAQTFTVSTLSTPINENNAYFSDNSTFTAATEIGRVDNYKFTPLNKVKTYTTDTSGTTGILRIPLYSSFGDMIINEIGDTTLKDSLQFKNFLPGIIVKNEGTSGNCMVQVAAGDGNSVIKLFIRDKDNNKIEIYMPLSELTVVNGTLGVKFNTVNLYAKDYSGTNIDATVSSAEISDSVNYVLGQAGLLTKISLPTLSNFGRVAVNKAVLEITQYIPNSATGQTPPNTLYLSRKNSTGDFASLLNYGVIAFASKDSSVFKLNGERYIKYMFNITGYVQDVLFGRDTQSDLYVNTHLHADETSTGNPLSTFGYTPAGIVIAGGNLADPNMKAKLKITYSPVR